ncbi:ABC transporter ATP-binding protein [Parapusillimonas sp. SGNA-6]|nr:ABC transporter ATP-binding protein [Parapusillimonas sp. SGNA-6]
MSSVSIRGLSKSYGDITVVRDVDLTINEGEFVVLLGPSGCGKTTILRLLAGFGDPTSGRIEIGGRDVTHVPPRHRDIGMVFQNYALFPNMSIGENIGFGMRQRKKDKASIKRQVHEMLKLIKLEGREHDDVTQLSGGQQQRVALARAIAPSPRLLLMDEALGALDQQLREELQIELLRIQRELKITTILVTHDQKEAMVLADRIVIMAAGQIQQVGTPTELYQNPANVFVANFIGQNNILRGQLAELDGRPVLKLDGGVVMPLKPERVRGLAYGVEVDLSIRPEHLILKSGGSPVQNAFSARVSEVIFLGNVLHCFVITPWGTRLMVESKAEGASLHIGQDVQISWSPDDALVFEADPGTN